MSEKRYNFVERVVDYIPVIKNLFFLQLIFILFSVQSLISKVASGMDFFSESFLMLYTLKLLILGVYAFFWQQVLKRVSLTLAYSNRGTVILWTFLWALLFLNEKIEINNVFGAIIIILGIILVTSDGT